MSKQIILQDIDGCVLNWCSKLPEFLKSKGLDPTRAIHAYATGEFVSPAELTGLPHEEAIELVDEYNASAYIKYLTPYTDALEVVNLLKDDFNFIAVTAIGMHSDSARNRLENLEFWYPGAFSDIHVVPLGESKTNILNTYEPTFFIDDSPNYAREGKEAGHFSIRLNRDSRPDETNTVRCNNWHEIGSILEIHKSAYPSGVCLD